MANPQEQIVQSRTQIILRVPRLAWLTFSPPPPPSADNLLWLHKPATIEDARLEPQANRNLAWMYSPEPSYKEYLPWKTRTIISEPIPYVPPQAWALSPTWLSNEPVYKEEMPWFHLPLPAIVEPPTAWPVRGWQTFLITGSPSPPPPTDNLLWLHKPVTTEQEVAAPAAVRGWQSFLATSAAVADNLPWIHRTTTAPEAIAPQPPPVPSVWVYSDFPNYKEELPWRHVIPYVDVAYPTPEVRNPSWFFSPLPVYQEQLPWRHVLIAAVIPDVPGWIAPRYPWAYPQIVGPPAPSPTLVTALAAQFIGSPQTIAIDADGVSELRPILFDFRSDPVIQKQGDSLISPQTLVFSQEPPEGLPELTLGGWTQVGNVAAITMSAPGSQVNAEYEVACRGDTTDGNVIEKLVTVLIVGVGD